MNITMKRLVPAGIVLLILQVGFAVADPVDKKVTVVGEAAGTDLKAKDKAIKQALRKAVAETCGVFLKARSKTSDYETIYDKVLADTTGYVREHKVLSVSTEDGITSATVRVHVSTVKFERAWTAIAHTVEQENNPRVIIAIVEAVKHTTRGPVYETDEAGTVQATVEDFFLEKGIKLMDRDTSAKVTKRDVLLAAIKDDTKKVAALGARFKADVVITGRASAKYGKRIEIAGQTMYQYTATLTIRAVRTDSAEILAVKSFGPVTMNTLQHGGGEDKALAKLAKESRGKILAAVVEGWRKQVNVARTLTLSITGMDYKAWKVFKTEVEALRGVKALRLREITEGIASIDAEYSYDNTDLADSLTELKKTKLDVTEITANRIKLKTVISEQ